MFFDALKLKSGGATALLNKLRVEAGSDSGTGGQTTAESERWLFVYALCLACEF